MSEYSVQKCNPKAPHLGAQAGRFLRRVCDSVDGLTCGCAFCQALRTIVRDDQQVFEQQRQIEKAMKERPANAKHLH